MFPETITKDRFLRDYMDKRDRKIAAKRDTKLHFLCLCEARKAESARKRNRKKLRKHSRQ